MYIKLTDWAKLNKALKTALWLLDRPHVREEKSKGIHQGDFKMATAPSPLLTNFTGGSSSGHLPRLEQAYAWNKKIMAANLDRPVIESGLRIEFQAAKAEGLPLMCSEDEYVATAMESMNGR